MRASLGFRAGPLYVGTGNLLKTRRGRRRGPGVLELFLVYPFIGIWLMLKYTALLYWWIALYTWRGGRWAVRRIKSANAARRTSPGRTYTRPNGN
jgi:hypothetical protein